MAKEKKSEKHKVKRDANGKFASAQPKNPDCEPATKGFVKCIVRSVYRDCAQDVNLNKNSVCHGTVICGVIAGVLWLFMLSLKADGDATFTVGATALVLMIVGIDMNEALTTIRLVFKEPGEIPEQLRKYEPPTCEKKKECDY